MEGYTQALLKIEGMSIRIFPSYVENSIGNLIRNEVLDESDARRIFKLYFINSKKFRLFFTGFDKSKCDLALRECMGDVNPRELLINIHYPDKNIKCIGCEVISVTRCTEHGLIWELNSSAMSSCYKDDENDIR